MSIIIRNGTIVTSNDTFEGELLIEEGIIKQIGRNLEENNAEIIDAGGNYIIPGGIDVHTHLNLDVGIAVATDDFYTGTIAAACGGTTTIVDHIGFGPKNCDLHHQINVYHYLAKDNAVVDYGFHGVIQHVNEDILDELEILVNNEGITSFKFYLAYDYKLNDLEAYKVLLKMQELGGMITVHPENDYIINHLREKFQIEGKTSPIYHALSRPEECEAEAINRMINIASMANNASLYIVHLTNGLGLEYIKFAQKRKQNVYAETCPQYLFLNQDHYKQDNFEGLKYIMSPPLREKFNQELLWEGIKDGSISVVATDHCPFDFTTKIKLGKDNFTKCPNGAPGIETRVPLIFSEGVMKKRIDIQKFVDVISTKPAKLFGLYPKKGEIAIGSDADLVIIDPNKKVVISNDMLHQNVDHTPFEGMTVQGYPILTMLRGKVIVKNNSFIGEKGYGKFIKRSKPYLNSIY